MAGKRVCRAAAVALSAPRPGCRAAVRPATRSGYSGIARSAAERAAAAACFAKWAESPV